MKEKIYIGIDLSKGTSKVAVIDNERSSISNPFTITNSKEGIEKLLSKLYSYKPDKITCSMKVSSNYWENMYSYLKEKGISCILLNPYQVKKYRQALGAKIKTDKVDAESIGKLIMGRRYENLYISDEDTINLRELVRAKHSF